MGRPPSPTVTRNDRVRRTSLWWCTTAFWPTTRTSNSFWYCRLDCPLFTWPLITWLFPERSKRNTRSSRTPTQRWLQNWCITFTRVSRTSSSGNWLSKWFNNWYDQPLRPMTTTEASGCLWQEGAFALVLKSKHYPGQCVATRRGSPLLVGIKTKTNLISDHIPIIYSSKGEAFLNKLTVDCLRMIELHERAD